jgi:hypothetical protein
MSKDYKSRKPRSYDTMNMLLNTKPGPMDSERRPKDRLRWEIEEGMEDDGVDGYAFWNELPEEPDDD